MTHPTRTAALVLSLAVVLTSGQPAAQVAEAPTLWTFTAEDEITSFALVSSGDVFVSTKTQSLLVGGTEGDMIWSTSDLHDCTSRGSYLQCRHRGERASLSVFPSTPYARLVVDERLLVFDLASGTTVFDSADHNLGDLESHQSALGLDLLLLFTERGRNDYVVSGVRLREGTSVWTSPVSITKDFQWIGMPGNGTALAYGKDADGERVLTLIDLLSGRVVWSRTDLLTRDAADVPAVPILDRHGSLLVFVNKDGPMLLGLGGELIWRADALAGEDPSGMLYQGEGTAFHPADRMYVHQDGEEFAVNALDGGVVWSYKPRRKPRSVERTERGMLFVSDRDVELLDLEDGSPVWSAPTELPDGPGYFVFGDDVIHYATKEELFVIDLTDGRLRTLALYELGPDKEVPEHVEIVDGDVVLMSGHAVARYGPDGDQIFRRTYRPVGLSRWARITGVATGILLGSPETAAAAVYGHFMAAANTERFYYIYFEDRDGDEAHRFGLAKINKTTGDELGPLWINQRNPDFLLTPAADAVIYKEGDTVIRAVRF